MKHIILILTFSTLLFAGVCDNKLFSLNANQAGNSTLTLMDIISQSAKECQISVIFDDKRSRTRLSQTMDLINIKDYTLEALFNFIFTEHNLFYTYDSQSSVLRVSYYKTENFNIDYVNVSELKTESVKSITVGAKAQTDDDDDDEAFSKEGSNSDLTTIKTTLSFTFWNQLKNHINEILTIDEDYDESINKVLVDRDAAVVTIAGTQRQLRKVKKYLDKIKSRMHNQVMIEAYLLELTYSDSNTSGVNWQNFEIKLDPSAAFYDAYHTNSKKTYSFNANISPSGIIDFLNKYGDVEILSNPKVLTLNNQPAIINVGEQLSYLYPSGEIGYTDSGRLASTQTYTLGSMFVGLTLNIIPEITEDNHIMMRINPVSSELANQKDESKISTDESKQTQRTMPPDTRIKQMSTIVKVKDNQRVIIGGLIEKKQASSNSKVPILGDIPLLGKLFSYNGKDTKRSELFIILTPTIIKNNEFPTLDDAIEKRLN